MLLRNTRGVAQLSLTPCSRFLLEKLTGPQLVKKHRAFYGNRSFISAFTITRHLSLSLATSIQSSFFKIRCNIILQSKTRSSKLAHSHKCHHQNVCMHSTLRYTCYMPRQSHSSWFDHPNSSRWEVQITKFYITSTLTANSSGIY
jgi:hypothetical protein